MNSSPNLRAQACDRHQVRDHITDLEDWLAQRVVGGAR